MTNVASTESLLIPREKKNHALPTEAQLEIGKVILIINWVPFTRVWLQRAPGYY